MKLYCDNLSAIKLADYPVFHARTKHVEVHYHFIREKVLRGDVDMRHIGTNGQIADIFTKGLNGVKIEEFRKKLGVVMSTAIKDNNN